MDIRTQISSEIRTLDRERIQRLQDKFADEAIEEWDRAECRYPLYYPVFIQLIVGQKWMELIQSN